MRLYTATQYSNANVATDVADWADVPKAFLDETVYAAVAKRKDPSTERSVSHEVGAVVFRAVADREYPGAELRAYGGDAVVRRSLERLAKAGRLVRYGRGVPRPYLRTDGTWMTAIVRVGVSEVRFATVEQDREWSVAAAEGDRSLDVADRRANELVNRLAVAGFKVREAPSRGVSISLSASEAEDLLRRLGAES